MNADKNATTEDDDEVAQELANMANMIEEGLISEEENLIELRNLEMVDRIVDTFVDIAFREMNPDQQTVSVHVECEECKNKSEKIASYSKKNEDNEEIITEKLAAVSGLILKVKNMMEERKEISKKLNETETLKKLVADKNKTINRLKAEIKSRDSLPAASTEKDSTKPKQSETEVQVKIKCRECDFTAATKEEIREHKREEKAKNRESPETYNGKSQNQEGPLSPGESSCNQCSFQNKNRVLLSEHKETQHNNLAKSDTRDEASIGMVNKEGPLSLEESSCNQCSFQSNNRVLMGEHKHKEHNNPIKCVTCGEVSIGMTNFRVHGRKHRSEFQNGAILTLQNMLFKCNQCSFQGETKVQFNNHNSKHHTEIQCLICEEKCSNVEIFRNHAKKHKMVGQVSYYPGNTAGFHCQDCRESYKNHDSFMNHLSQVHLTEGQRQGAGLAKYIGGGYEGQGQEQENQLEQGQGGRGTKGRESQSPLCRNGPECRFHRQHRCNFHHPQPPQGQGRRHLRQAPSDQWQQMPPLRTHNNNQGQDQSSHEQRPQGHKYWSVPPQGDLSAPWCFHGRGCPMGRYCVLRHDNMDFPNLPIQGRQ